MAFLNLTEYEAKAREILPVPVFDYYYGGANDEITVRENCAASQPQKERRRKFGALSIDLKRPLEFQDEVHGKSHLVAFGVLIEWLEPMGQRLVVADFRPYQQTGDRLRHRRLNGHAPGKFEIGRFAASQVARIDRKAGEKVVTP